MRALSLAKMGWIATAKVHKRGANHNAFMQVEAGILVGLLLRRYINGEPITTRIVVSRDLLVLDCYCEGT